MSERIRKMLESFREMHAKKAGKRKAGILVEAEWLLGMCIDCRYPHVIHEYMKNNYPNELYDQIVLAGASLALVDSYTSRDHWSKTFLEQIEISINLHNIAGVLIIDHRTCGAFREFKILEKPQENTPLELDRHKEVANIAGRMVLSQFRKQGKPGFVQVWLAPEVFDASANDFPSDPILLYQEST